MVCLPLHSLQEIEVICHYWRGSAVDCHGTWVISSVCPAVQTDITAGSHFSAFNTELGQKPCSSYLCHPALLSPKTDILSLNI